MSGSSWSETAAKLHRLPKAELHLHLEGCLSPELVVKLAEGHGEKLNRQEVAERYSIKSFPAFLELFKWATTYLRTPRDYARLAEAVALDLRAQNCLYAEITLSVGVMLLRNQDAEANFATILDALAKSPDTSRVQIRWIFDAVRQFGPEKAMQVARLAAQMKSQGVVAFGLGGDEESLPAADFRGVYDYAAAAGLHCLAHAGEMGGPQSVRDAIEIFRAERIGHGIATIRDEALMDLLIERQIPLEICSESNLRTGALAKLLGSPSARLEDHPLRQFVARGVPVTLSTDDPAMFHTTLGDTYTLAVEKMGLNVAQLVSIAEAAFHHAFLPPREKQVLLDRFHTEARSLDLL
ncbi:MAG TPA: adenosine deaminase [Candidatus Acidoferrales bacterium]|nr:adenosine deaminase [Candidatus Acidoferrales bacterium]